MFELPMYEIISIVAGVATSFLGLFFAVYRKIMKPIIKYFNRLSSHMEDHSQLMKNVEAIKKEITPNGGSSIKDTIDRIERRQLVIDERSKAVFYGKEKPIFEVDNEGNIQWANKQFHKSMGHKNLSGLIWVSFIDEPQRKEFLQEFKSCAETGREINYEIVTHEKNTAVMYGFPFKDKKNNTNYGFLIYVLY